MSVDGGGAGTLTMLFEMGDGVLAGSEVMVREQDGCVADTDLVTVSECGLLRHFSVVEKRAVFAVEVEGGISAGVFVEADLQVLARDVFIDYLDGEVL